jgi:hypothetical protein
MSDLQKEIANEIRQGTRAQALDAALKTEIKRETALTRVWVVRGAAGLLGVAAIAGALVAIGERKDAHQSAQPCVESYILSDVEGGEGSLDVECTHASHVVSVKETVADVGSRLRAEIRRYEVTCRCPHE